MQRYLTLLLGALALVASVATASAQFSVQVGVQGGASIASTAIDIGPVSVDGAGMKSVRPDVGIRVGADYRIVGSPIVLGVFGEYNIQDVAFDISPALLKASLGNSYTVGGRAGFLVGNSMPYVLLGWTRTDANWSSGLGPVTGLPDSFTGYTVGGGIEIPLNRHMTLATEARWTQFSSEQLAPGVDLTPTQLSAMLRLNIAIGSLLDSAPAYRPVK